MIAPAPFKLQCPLCGFCKVVKLKSDVINPMDMNNICPRCNTTMERKKLNLLDKFLILLKR